MVSIEKRIHAAKMQAVSYRNYRRARDRALVRLANAYPDEYKQYLQEEKAKDEQENKKWLDIAGNTNSLAEPYVPTTIENRNRQTTTQQGNDGREA